MGKRRERSLKGAWATLAVACAMALAYLSYSGRPSLLALEGATLDLRFELRGPRPVSDQVALLLIDDASIRELGPWPLSRDLLGRTVTLLSEQGASIIALDLLLEGEAREAGADEALAASLSGSGRALLPFAFVYTQGEGEARELPWPIAESAFRVVLEAGDAPPGRPMPLGFIAPEPVLMEGASSLGQVNIFPDASGRLRSFLPAVRHGEFYYPALVLEALRLHLGLSRDEMTLEVGRRLTLGQRSFELDEAGRLFVDFPDAGESLASYPLDDFLRGEVPDGAFKGRIVLIGAKAVGVGDSYATPFNPSLAGVEFLGALLDNLIGERFLERQAPLDVAAVILLGLLASLLWLLQRPLAICAGVLAILLGWWGLTCLALAFQGLWLNFTFPAATLVLCGVLVLLGQALRSRAGALEGERLRRFVTPLAAAHLERKGGAEREELRQLTLLFIDMIGFTRRSETLKPAEVMALVRPYHQRISEIAKTEGGLIESFSGDGALIVFGMKEGSLGGAAEAVSCAQKLAEAFDAEGAEAIRVGIGINMGLVAVGMAGGEESAEITVNGDPVNVASRLEGLTRTLGRTIVASEAVIEAAKAERGATLIEGFEPLPLQEIRGRERPLPVWGWPKRESA